MGGGPGPLPHELVCLVPHRMCASTPTACLSTCGRKSLSPSTSLSTFSTSSTLRGSSKARSHRCRSTGLMCTGEDGGGWAGTQAWFVLSVDITPIASKGRSRENKNKQKGRTARACKTWVQTAFLPLMASPINGHELEQTLGDGEQTHGVTKRRTVHSIQQQRVCLMSP